MSVCSNIVSSHTISEIDTFLQRLFPICRSITGEGTRKTLKILQEIVPIEVKEYPCRQSVFDWTIPLEWNIRDAWIKNTKGEKIIDFQKNNLHVVSYSQPINRKIGFVELKEHMNFRKDIPNAIPYCTSYYKEDWGFCVSYQDFKNKFHEAEEYEVFIDSDFKDGVLNYAELVIPGKCSKEYLISCYICHPSMANDSLSGFLLTAFLSKTLLKLDLNFSYRIIFLPETIGAIAYCANNIEIMNKIETGLVITTVGGPGPFGYKKSFDPNNPINGMIEQVFIENSVDFITYKFDVHGSDERQYSSPGLRINVATISKDKYYEYDYYHTSLDNLDFVKAENINLTLDLYLQLIEKLDKNLIYERINPNCEIMLSKNDLYPKLGGKFTPENSRQTELDLIVWLLFYFDGSTSLWDISQKLNTSIEELDEVARKLLAKGILKISN